MRFLLLWGGVSLLWGASVPLRAEITLPEQQVKARFLFYFAKYVEWPTKVFPQSDTPITIGVMGDKKLESDLKDFVEDKSVGGRKVVVQRMEKGGAWEQCHILYISPLEKKHLSEVLRPSPPPPILTVGESEQFLEQGGIIKFVKKEKNIRLEINLEAARRVKLQISSKLLGVADLVQGKP